MVKVVWDKPTATDNSVLTPVVTCDVESGSTFEIGQTQITCEALDGSNNTASCFFTVIIPGKLGIYSYFKSMTKSEKYGLFPVLYT